MTKAGIDITTGEIDLNPFQHKQQNACTFCPFKSVCQFDPIIETNTFKKIPDIKDDDILTILRKEGDK